MCAQSSDKELPSNVFSIFYFVGKLMYNSKRSIVDQIISCLIVLKQCLDKRNYRVLPVEESIFLLFLDDSFFPSQRNNVLLVNNCDFMTLHYKWAVIELRTESTKYKIPFLFIPSSKVSSNTLVITNFTLCNIKLYLNIPYLCSLKDVKLKVHSSFDDFSPPEANKVVLSFLNHNLVLPLGALTKIFSDYLKHSRYIHSGDICCISLRLYFDENMEEYLYFKILSVEGPNSKNYFNTYIINDSTSIVDQPTQMNFLPSVEWHLLDSKNISTLTTVLPLGLEKYYCTILKWFYPFLINEITELQPIFILNGVSGVGKSVLLNAISKRLGVSYMKFDCNNIISSTTTQIKSNLKNIFKSAKESSPVILHLKHTELLTSDAGGNDSTQLTDALSETMSSLKSSEGIIVVFTCYDSDNLTAPFYNMCLQSLHIECPTEQERELMLSWLAHRYTVPLDSSVLKYAAAESHSFTLSDLTRMLCLSNKIRVQSGSTGPLLREHLKIFLDERKGKEKLTEVEWEDVGGVEKLKKEVLSSLMSSKLIPGLERRGLLLHGPPGTGKTLLARAVASQCNRSFFPVKGPELLNMYVGQSEANIRQVFANARESAPAILFFDELDSLAPNRGNKSDSGGVMDRVVSQLLAEMDGLDNNSDVFILAATNRPDLIDPALIRPGRFDKMLYVGPCGDEDSKEKVLKAVTRKFKFEDNIEMKELVALLPNEVTGANIYALCSLAWMEAAREIINDPKMKRDTQVIVGRRHFTRAILDVRIS